MSITPHAVITENNEINYEIPINAESTKSVLLYQSCLLYTSDAADE